MNLPKCDVCKRRIGLDDLDEMLYIPEPGSVRCFGCVRDHLLDLRNDLSYARSVAIDYKAKLPAVLHQIEVMIRDRRISTMVAHELVAEWAWALEYLDGVDDHIEHMEVRIRDVDGLLAPGALPPR